MTTPRNLAAAMIYQHLPTWRDLWPQQQPWRSLSWRAHRIAEAKREDEEAEAMAIAYALHQQVQRQQGACSIQSAFRGHRGEHEVPVGAELSGRGERVRQEAAVWQHGRRGAEGEHGRGEYRGGLQREQRLVRRGDRL